MNRERSIMRVMGMILLAAACAGAAAPQESRAMRLPPQEVFDADAYASVTAAAKSLVERWMRRSTDVETAKEIAVSAAGVPQNVREAFAAALAARIPGAKVTFEGAVPPALQLGWMQSAPKTHQLRLNDLSTTVRDKPWVDDPNAVPHASGSEVWLVARSSSPCADEASASAAARRTAAELLLPMARDKARQGRHRGGPVDLDESLRRAIEAELRPGTGVITDRFVQRFDRPYGRLWQETVLVHLPSGRLGAIVASVSARADHAQRVRTHTMLSVVGILVASYLVYLLANMLTRGYFVWRLRMSMAAIALVLGIFMVAWMAS